MNWINQLFSSSGFMPHGFCYTWDPYVIGLNAISDALIALAYYTIPITLVYFVRRRSDLAFHGMFLCFALFIVACGTTHVIEVLSIWRPMYWLQGTIKAVTAGFSILTATALIPLVPKALALPSPEELRRANRALKEAQYGLRKTNEELEERIAERTSLLAEANATLKAEIEERKRVEEHLRESERQLRTAIARSPIPAIIFDEGGAVRFLSQSWTDCSGYALEEISTLTDWTVKAYGEKAEAAGTPFDKQFAISEAVRSGERLTRAKNGRQLIWDVYSTPLGKDPSGVRLLMAQAVDITERKEAEADTRQANEQLREQAAVLELAPVLVRDLEGIIVVWTRGAERLYGYSKAQALGRVSHELFQTEFAEGRADVDEKLRRCCHWEGELVHRKRNGERLVVASQQIVYCDSTGRPVRILEVNADITERKAAEERLREKDQQFRQLAENISEVLWMSDPAKSQLLFVSPAYETLWGRTCQSLYESPSTWFEAVHPEDRDQIVQPSLTRHVEAAYDEQYRIVRPDGAISWIRNRYFPVRDATGQVNRVVGVAQDITATKEAELEQLDRRETRFRSLIEHASDLIAALNAEGLIRFQSPSVERVLGYLPGELLDRNVFEFIHPEDLPQVQSAFQGVVSEPYATVSVEYRFRHRKGSWRLLQSTGRALPADGDECLMVLNSRDVTEQKCLEAQLRQAQKMEAVGQLAGGVAHDFNNLLSVICGHSQLLEMSLPADEQSRESLAEIAWAAERAALLTRQLLAFSRQQVLEPLVLDLNTVVATAEKMLRRIIGEGIRLITRLQPNLSPVRTDPGQLDQVLLNLAINARDAMPQGGCLTFRTCNIELPQAYVEAHPEVRPGPRVLLTVTDTGCGMSPEVQARIFEPFFTTKALGQGTGLGLSVVQGIVEQSGGHVEVDSLPGVGTTFKLYLPAVEEALTTASQDVPAKRPRGSGERVLLAEDEESVRLTTSLLLGRLGYRVLEASSGEEALRVAEASREKIELLITDVVMPGINGCQLADSLRSRDPGLKVLFQSGYTADAVLHHGIMEAESTFLRKPFTLEALDKKVRELLDQGSG
jgi:two-component system, cell cycle sensor histidine kinase and response regulator CckA